MTVYMMHDAPARPQVVRLIWEHITEPDDCTDKPDERDDGFWPSRDPEDAGYIGEGADFEAAQAAAEERMQAWRDGDWEFIGTRAKLTAHVPIGQGSFVTYEFVSPGLWGTESDSDEDYLNSIFEEEKAALLGHLKTLGLFLIAWDRIV